MSTSPPADLLNSIDRIVQGFAHEGYICKRNIATAVYLAHHLGKPVLVEGPAGVGKTELAKTTALMLDLPLIRLQCYEGLDESKALYEWKYGKQLLYTQILKDKMADVLQDAEGLSQAMTRLHRFSDVFFSEQFLEPRPLLRALQQKAGAVLLIDEVDKSDHEFEAFLLEILSDFQVSIPEIGTIHAVTKPFVFLTSNKAREMSDALMRRCIHLYIPYPDMKLEREIIHARVPEVPTRLRNQLVSFIQQVREMDLKKAPAVSETIDWARALLLLHADSLQPDLVRETLNLFLKFQDDIETVEPKVSELTYVAHEQAG